MSIVPGQRDVQLSGASKSTDSNRSNGRNAATIRNQQSMLESDVFS